MAMGELCWWWLRTPADGDKKTHHEGGRVRGQQIRKEVWIVSMLHSLNYKRKGGRNKTASEPEKARERDKFLLRY